MSVSQGTKVWTVALAAVAVISTCQPSGPGVPLTGATGVLGDTEALLAGTWIREFDKDGAAIHHVLALLPDHRFRETVRVTEASGHSARYMHEGTWLYDGTNLKRRYTLMNGRPPSRLNLPFATFQITFDSPRTFRGVDHIHGNVVEYRRVADDTQP